MELSTDAFINLQSRKDISFITFTNYGYIHYTKNLILSLEKCNFPISLKVYCIDQKSFDELKQWNKNTILEMLNDETNTSENIVGWKEEGWNTMAFSKLKCIHKELFKNPYVFFTDSDIVFENNYCLQYLIDNLKDYDMLIQRNMRDIICTGFMFIQSNETMKNLFNWRKIDINKFICDEDYVNENKESFNYQCLSRDLFPTERYYYRNNDNKFLIIHFNKNKGDDKLNSMKLYNKWYNYDKTKIPDIIIRDTKVIKNQDTLNIYDDVWTCSDEMREDIRTMFHDKNYTIIEIGSYKGYTTKVFSDIFTKVYAIDNNPELIKLNRKFNAGSKNITCIEFDLYKDDWGKLPTDIDVAFIDAQHDYESCKSDILNSIQYFKNLKYIILDDYGVFHDVKKIIDELLLNNTLKFESYIGLNDIPSLHDIIKNSSEGIICSVLNA